MSITIHDADRSDLDQMVALLVEDGQQREARDPTLWKMDASAAEKVKTSLVATMQDEAPAIRQKWLLAAFKGRIVGIAHTILLPVPPIYAGEFGPPGLIMEDCFVTEDAPEGAAQSLLNAAERNLRRAGAKILLASSVAGGLWENVYASSDYEPLTLYLAKVGLRASTEMKSVRLARSEDVDGIVSSSAENRKILFDLNAFWKPHSNADARFDAWMRKSLTLPDRDMFVSAADGVVMGYAISQPATRLHFPSPHDIGAIGVIDDYYHAELSDPASLLSKGDDAARLLRAAEAALHTRGRDAALVVCPAAWASKVAVLEAAGYRNAITWFKKRAV